jgi:hypothetical protein
MQVLLSTIDVVNRDFELEMRLNLLLLGNGFQFSICPEPLSTAGHGAAPDASYLS